MGWSMRALAREAFLNVRSGWWRSLLVVAVIGGAVGLVVFLELRQAAEATRFQREYARAGGFVAVVSSPGAPLEAGRCAALNARPDVVAAGGVRTSGTVSFTSAPGVLFQSADISGRGIEVWAPGSVLPPAGMQPSAIVGTALAAEIGVAAGSFLQVEGAGVAAVRYVVDAERRNPRIQRWMLTETPPAGPIEECWVEFERPTYTAGLASLGAWFATGDDDPLVRPYIRPDEFTRDVAAEFDDRPQRFGWAAIGLLAAAVFLLISWFRRAELGLYLAVGTSRMDLFAMLAIESLAMIGCAALGGTALVMAIRSWSEGAVPADHLLVAVATAGAGVLLAVCVAPLASLAAARGNLASMLKER